MNSAIYSDTGQLAPYTLGSESVFVPRMLLSLWRGECEAPPSFPRMAQIAQEVAADYGIRVTDMLGQSVEHRFAHPRQDFWWRCRQVKDHRGKQRFSLPQIGRFSHRDHSTVRTGVIQHKARCAR